MGLFPAAGHFSSRRSARPSRLCVLCSRSLHLGFGGRSEHQRRADARFLRDRAITERGIFATPVFIARAGRDNEYLLKGTDKFLTIATAKNIPLVFMNHPQGLRHPE
jgi:hypothetical protein